MELEKTYHGDELRTSVSGSHNNPGPAYVAATGHVAAIPGGTTHGSQQSVDTMKLESNQIDQPPNRKQINERRRENKTHFVVGFSLLITVAVIATSALLLAVVSIWPVNHRMMSKDQIHTVYTRWGNAKCPSNNTTKMVYNGLMAGHKTSTTQSITTEFLCLPLENVEYKDLELSGANETIYGTEYRSPIKTESNIDNVPCAVCLVSGRSLTKMIPGKTTCPNGWTKDYYGYLMSQNGAYECTDKNMEAHPGSAQMDNNVATVVHVTVSCDSLPCDPYVANRGLTCVVCSI